jgi:hypothetical protein
MGSAALSRAAKYYPYHSERGCRGGLIIEEGPMPAAPLFLAYHSRARARPPKLATRLSAGHSHTVRQR